MSTLCWSLPSQIVVVFVVIGNNGREVRVENVGLGEVLVELGVLEQKEKKLI